MRLLKQIAIKIVTIPNYEAYSTDWMQSTSDSRVSYLSLIAVERELSDKLLKWMILQTLLTSFWFATIDASVCYCNQCDVRCNKALYHFTGYVYFVQAFHADSGETVALTPHLILTKMHR